MSSQPPSGVPHPSGDARRLDDELRALTARLHEVREEERAAIARELHDELGRDLTMLTLDLTWLRERLPGLTPDNARQPVAEKLAAMERSVQATLQTVRRILGDLRPPLLDELGLKDAVEFHLEEFSRRVGMRSDFNATFVVVACDKTRIAVFRIFQEVLTNVARHAKASRVRVELIGTASSLALTVEDNGCGISPEALAHAKGFGILGIRERARSIGGEIEIHRLAPSGTRVTLRVPLAAGASPGDREPLVIRDTAGGGPALPQADLPLDPR